MKIQNLKTRVIGPILLLIPMACMQLGESPSSPSPSGPPAGPHSGRGHFSAPSPTFRSSIHDKMAADKIGNPGTIGRDSITGPEGMTIHLDGEKESDLKNHRIG